MQSRLLLLVFACCLSLLTAADELSKAAAQEAEPDPITADPAVDPAPDPRPEPSLDPSLEPSLGPPLEAALESSAGAQDDLQDDLDVSAQERLEQELGRLQAVERNLSLSQEKQTALELEVKAFDLDRAQITEDLIKTNERINELEERIEDAGRRLTDLIESQRRVRFSLESRREILAQLLSSLQRLGAKPPPALAVHPEDALGAVRSALLISALMPEIHRETEALAADLAELDAIKNEIAKERGDLTVDLAARAEDQIRLSLLIDEKQRSRQRQQGALNEEQERAQALARDADSLRGLIKALEEDVALAARAAERAARARAETPPSATDFGRLSPAIRFADAKGQLPLPARGVILTEFGDLDRATGDLAEGITLATRSGARIVSPADGRVAYAGPFRRYGDVLILDAGDDYHLLIAGIGRLDVVLGQFVLSGEPIGEMGDRRLASAANVSLESSQPTLYIELREKGTPVDPSPWWLRPNEEKESG